MKSSAAVTPAELAEPPSRDEIMQMVLEELRLLSHNVKTLEKKNDQMKSKLESMEEHNALKLDALSGSIRGLEEGLLQHTGGERISRPPLGMAIMKDRGSSASAIAETLYLMYSKPP